MITMGVEEEYLLLDPVTALPVPLAGEVRAASGMQAMTEAREVQTELLQAQLEAATPVCTGLAEVGGHLLRLRRAIGTAAQKAGCRLVACGTAPLAGGAPVPVTEGERYQALQAQGARLVDEQLVNGMHVHVGVPDRAQAVGALNRLRPWLPVLVAMGANSPLWRGRDTGFASWRTVVFGRWPVSGPPPLFEGPGDYDRRVGALLGAGAILDTGQLYWQARVSERYPTLEVRALDVQLTVEDAVLFAGIVRALVATALREEREGVPLVPCPPEMLHAANWHAARYGLHRGLIDAHGRRRGPGEAVGGLLAHIAPALDEAGDTREVNRLLRLFLGRGGPADRQRRALASGGLAALVALAATENTEP
ncbi:carboxylate-amine ligase [Streptomyces telluris]|uniref:Putative glutamate--cysteine ligase 2 n=1 Tax=Streptomyces telluris TaxID=2720021 RepID=A0A9X2RSG8_9ACTN|nr:glutamate--cysteine ligase [Streptomyces telluris]MCQ8774631.1 glutamate--cysteine ligase [Streptomyces telluris]NJP78890.1 glutamate--cysteine ligase [Streptomyces telluris]